MSDPNEPSRFECEQQERADAIAEERQTGADEKSYEDQAYALIDEAITFQAQIECARLDEYRGYLLTDSAKAANMLDDRILAISKRRDGGNK